jgi:predicted Fe-S protein YdhL (DUF1289 family)
MTEPASPCVKVCVVDPVSGLCIGCGRTIAEISDWSEMGEAGRLKTLAELPQRIAAMVARSTRGGRTRARRAAAER